MSDMIRLYTDEIIWGNGTTFQEEPIRVADNGWVYKPQKLIVPGEKRTWGKGYDAKSKATKYLKNQLENAAAEADYARPISAGRAKNADLSWWHGNDGLSVIIWDDVFGFVELGMVVEHSTYTMDFQIKYRAKMATLLHHLAMRKIEAADRLHFESANRHNFTNHTIVDGTSVSITELKSLIDQFRNDPFKAISTQLPLPWDNLFHLLNLRPGTPDWAEYKRETIEAVAESETQTIFYAESGNISRYLGNDMVVFTVEEMDILERLFRSFRYLGMQATVQWAYGSWESKRPESIYVRVPASNEKGQEHPHDIAMTSKGIRIDCGYVSDHQRYLEYQQRAALDFLKEIQAEPSYEETVIDMKGSE